MNNFEIVQSKTGSGNSYIKFVKDFEIGDFDIEPGLRVFNESRSPDWSQQFCFSYYDPTLNHPLSSYFSNMDEYLNKTLYLSVYSKTEEYNDTVETQDAIALFRTRYLNKINETANRIAGASYAEFKEKEVKYLLTRPVMPTIKLAELNMELSILKTDVLKKADQIAKEEMATRLNQLSGLNWYDAEPNVIESVKLKMLVNNG